MTTQPTTRAPHPRVRALGLAFALGAATLGLTLGPALPAAAQTAPIVGIEVDASDGSSSTAIDIQDLYPGSTQEAVLFLTGDRADEVDNLALTLSGLEDLENGCNRPETNTSDTSCGDGTDQGELSRWLAVTYTGGIETTDRTGRACTIPAGTSSTTELMSDLARRDPATGAVAVAPPAGRREGDVRCVVIAFHHEDRGPEDNVTQTDSVRFDLGIHLSGELPPQVEGIQIPNDGQPAPGEPSTPGTPILGGPPPEQPVVLPIEVGGEVIEKDSAPAGPDRDGPRTVHPNEVVTAGDSLMLGLPRTGSTLVVELLAIAFLLLTLGAFALRRRDRNDQEVSS